MTATEQDAGEVLLIDAKEASRRLGIGKNKLWLLTNCGEVPVVRIGRRTLYSPAALAEWIEAKQEGGRR